MAFAAAAAMDKKNADEREVAAEHLRVELRPA